MPTTPHATRVSMEYHSQRGICTCECLLKGKDDDRYGGEEQAESLYGTKPLVQDGDREHDGDHGIERRCRSDQGCVAIGVIRGEKREAADSRKDAVEYSVCDSGRTFFDFAATREEECETDRNSANGEQELHRVWRNLS